MPRVSSPAPPDYVLRFWRSLDAIVGEVRPQWWGAVVTEPRFPQVWDVNYARIDEPAEDLALAEVEAALLPALDAAGASMHHVVSFHPGSTRSLFAELEAQGYRPTWDLVMELRAPAGPLDALHRIEELVPGPDLWVRVRDSLDLFGVEAGVAGQLTAMERDVLAPRGKRWFGARGADGSIESMGALLVLEDVGYLDNVVTFDRARRRGLASAVTRTLVEAAMGSGVGRVMLLADPGDRSVVRLYERLGFQSAGTLASTRGPIAG